MRLHAGVRLRADGSLLDAPPDADVATSGPTIVPADGHEASVAPVHRPCGARAFRRRHPQDVAAAGRGHDRPDLAVGLVRRRRPARARSAAAARRARRAAGSLGRVMATVPRGFAAVGLDADAAGRARALRRDCRRAERAAAAADHRADARCARTSSTRCGRGCTAPSPAPPGCTSPATAPRLSARCSRSGRPRRQRRVLPARSLRDRRASRWSTSRGAAACRRR